MRGNKPWDPNPGRINPRGMLGKESLRGLGRKKPKETAARSRTKKTLAAALGSLGWNPV